MPVWAKNKTAVDLVLRDLLAVGRPFDKPFEEGRSTAGADRTGMPPSVPGSDVQAVPHAQWTPYPSHNNDEFKHDREPVLLTDGAGEAGEDHGLMSRVWLKEASG